jgi:protocatechuate 3,4-dioxygenase beta subunit
MLKKSDIPILQFPFNEIQEVFMSEEQRFSRRAVLKISLAMGGVLMTGPQNLVSAASARLTPTSEQAMGPFYPVVKPVDQDSDLTVIQGKAGRAQGQVIYVQGRVTDSKGNPVAEALVEIWQANAKGRYTHPNDRNPAPLDPLFQGYGLVRTDAQGRYRFKTVKPAPYPASDIWIRPPHIHFQVTAGPRRLVTQMYFEGEPLNEKDRLFKSAERPETLLTKLTRPSKDQDQTALMAAWDIVL